jgi:hypothetical protein
MSILPDNFESRLAAVAPSGIQFTTTENKKGVCCSWCTLASKDDLLPSAALLKSIGARLSTITILQPKAPSTPPPEGETPVAPTNFGGTATTARHSKSTTTSTSTATR